VAAERPAGAAERWGGKSAAGAAPCACAQGSYASGLRRLLFHAEHAGGDVAVLVVAVEAGGFGL